MNNALVTEIVILVLMLILSAFFSSAETAFMSANPVRIRAMEQEGIKGAKDVLKIAEDFPKLLSAILIGNNIVNLTASALTTVIVTRIFGSFAIGIGTGVLTVLVLIFGEITPKTAAKVNAEKIALIYAKPLLFIMFILTPVIAIINAVSGVILKIFGVDPDSRASMTENELRTYVDVSHEDGVIESGEKEMIINVFDFGDARAKDVMIPRIDMTCIDVSAGYDEVMKVFKQDMYTRIPVYDENPDNIIGVLNIKDMVFVDPEMPFNIRRHMREAFYTFENKATSGLMMEMREKFHNIAFVLSEYGETVGMITMEDLLEELVGEIRDEYDQHEETLIRDLGEGRYLIEANMKLTDINDALHTSFDSEDYDSIGGLMIEMLERLPHNRESVTLKDGIELSCRGIANHRIMKVLVTLPAEEEEKDG